MLRSQNPNRFFGVNPASIPNQGRKLTPWSKELPKDWRSALGLDGEDARAAEPESADSSE